MTAYGFPGTPVYYHSHTGSQTSSSEMHSFAVAQQDYASAHPLSSTYPGQPLGNRTSYGCIPEHQCVINQVGQYHQPSLNADHIMSTVQQGSCRPSHPLAEQEEPEHKKQRTIYDDNKNSNNPVSLFQETNSTSHIATVAPNNYYPNINPYMGIPVTATSECGNQQHLNTPTPRNLDDNVLLLNDAVPLINNSSNNYTFEQPKQQSPLQGPCYTGGNNSTNNNNPMVLADRVKKSLGCWVDGDLDVNGVVRSHGFFQYSDIRLKTRIEDIVDAVEIVSQLKGKIYCWKKHTPMYEEDEDGNGKKVIGLIAQEVQKGTHFLFSFKKNLI